MMWWIVAIAILLPLSGASGDEYDQRWVKQTLRTERHVHRQQVRRRPQPRVIYRDRVARPKEPESTRVFGFVAHVGGPCRPAVENISREHTSEKAAWNDAQLGWMKAVSVRYGAMYADVQNVDARTLRRQCFRSSFDESWVARNLEALVQNTGTGPGYKTTCRIIASPCIAPITNDTPLKGDTPQ